MTALDLMLPEHLYKKSRDHQGEVTGVTYLHDRLINWCDRGKGVQTLCRTVYHVFMGIRYLVLDKSMSLLNGKSSQSK
jgi:hypothetical protein